MNISNSIGIRLLKLIGARIKSAVKIHSWRLLPLVFAGLTFWALFLFWSSADEIHGWLVIPGGFFMGLTAALTLVMLLITLFIPSRKETIP